jgi:hypothetical protein
MYPNLTLYSFLYLLINFHQNLLIPLSKNLDLYSLKSIFLYDKSQILNVNYFIIIHFYFIRFSLIPPFQFKRLFLFIFYYFHLINPL